MRSHDLPMQYCQYSSGKFDQLLPPDCDTQHTTMNRRTFLGACIGCGLLGFAPGVQGAEDHTLQLALAPADLSAAPGDDVSVDIVLQGPDNGVSAFDLTVETADSSVIEFTDATIERDTLVDDIAVTAESVELEAALGDNTYDPADEVVPVTLELTVVDAGSTSLEFGESDVSDLDNNLYSITEMGGTSVTSDDDADPAMFDVEILSTTSPVVEGESISATVELENVGGDAGEQSVTASIDGVSDDTHVVALDPGETIERTFVLGTNTGDAGSHSLVVASENDSAEEPVTIEQADEDEHEDEDDDDGEEDNGDNGEEDDGDEEENGANGDEEDDDEEEDNGDDGEEDEGDAEANGENGDEDDEQEDDGDREEGDEEADDTGTAADDADDDGPGFGVVTTLASIGGVGYLLRRRFESSSEE